MTLGTGILGEVILGDGDSVSGTPTPTPTPTPTSTTSKSSTIIDSNVIIPNGNLTTSLRFIAVDKGTDEFLLDLTGFSVSMVRLDGSAVAVSNVVITQVNKTIVPGVYSLLCNQDTTLPVNSDFGSVLYRITHASIDPMTIRVQIQRPKITVGNTLYVQTTTGATQLANNSMASLIQFMNALGINSNLVKVSGSADTLSRFAQAVDGNTLCVVGTGSTLTTIVTSSCDPVGVAGNPDQFAGKAGTFPKDTITPELRGKSFRITGSTGAVNPILTVTGLTIVPADGDKFNIL